MKEQIDNDRTLIKLWIYEIRERLVKDCTISNNAEMFLEDYDRGIVIELRSPLVRLGIYKKIPDCLIRAYKTNKDVLLTEIENILSDFDNAEIRALNAKDIRGTE